MREIKIRYNWERKEDGHIYQVIVPIECLEGKGDTPFLGNKLWKLIGRDLFVCLKDKNGKEIYEGDVIYYAGTQAIVKFDNGAFRTIYKLKQEMTPVLQKQNQQQYEIIGNIYENPNLMKNDKSN